MLTNTHYLLRHAISFFLGLIAIPAVDSILNIQIWSILALPVVYFIANKGILFYQEHSQAKLNQLTRSQYLQIDEQLALATQNANLLNKQYVQVRTVKSFKLIYDMSKLSKRIIAIVKKEPSKFYLIEDFFYSHLPSALELSDKYALFTKEKVTGTDIHLALNDARNALKDLYETMELDLKKALASDIESLKIEIDYAKLTNKERQEQLKIGGDE